MSAKHSSSELRYVTQDLIAVLGSPEFAAEARERADAKSTTLPIYRKLSELRTALEETGHNITHRALQNMCRDGRVKALRTDGGQWRLSESEFQRVMAERGGKPSRENPHLKRKPDDVEGNYQRLLQRRYGLTSEAYQGLHDRQGGRCAICKCDPKVKYAHLALNQQRLHIDHWHDDTTAVRGLLCGNCNFGIGRWLDNPQLLKAAIRYLDKHIPLRLGDTA